MGKYKPEHDSALSDLSGYEGASYSPGQFIASQFDLTQFFVATVNTGHFKPDHDSALIDVANATPFKIEHDGALIDVGLAGA